MIPEDRETRLRRKTAAAALTAAGFPIAATTLATMATRGGGPPYQKFGAIVLYRWADLLSWALERLTPPRCSTSEQDVTLIQPVGPNWPA